MRKLLRPLALLLAGLGLLWLLAPRAAELPAPAPRATSPDSAADGVPPSVPTASAAPVKAAERVMARAVTPIASLAGATGTPAQLAVRDENAGAIFTPKGIRINLLPRRPRKGERPDPSRPGWGLEWGIEGAREVEPRPEAEQAAKVHDLRGKPEAWKSNQKTYGRVVYEQVKPGLDLIVDAAAHGVKYTLRAARAADLTQLRLRYAGSTGLSASADGSTLEIGAGAGSIRESGLVVTQEGRPIAAGYRVTGRDTYAIDLHGADPGKAVEVDPLIGWSTYLGGTLNQGNGGDYGAAIAVDGSGNVYVGGQTHSGDFPIVGGFDATLGGFQDGFVTKFSPGGVPQWTSYLGGAGYDAVTGIAVDASGGMPNVYVTGRSDSADFPLVNPIDGGLNNTDAFVAKISGSGVSITWSTFLGGNGYDEGRSIAVDAAGANVWVAGYTSSMDFPTGGGGFDSSLGGSADLFLTKLNGGGTLITWSTYVGGSEYEDIGGMAVDGSGAVFLSGYTYSVDFPVTGGSTLISIPDVFVIKVKPAATGLDWGRFLGGSDYDVGTDVAVDGAGNCFVTGYTYSFNFPVMGAPVYDGTQGGGTDAFLTKLDSAGLILFSTYLGGNGYDYATRVRVDGSNRAVVAGYTSTFDATFPKVAAAFPAFNGGYYDAFVTKFSPSGSSLLYSTYYGGDSDEQIAGMAMDGSGNVLLTGYTISTPPSFPTTGAFDNTLGGGQDAFVARFSGGGGLNYSSYLGGNRSIGEDYGKTVDVDDLGNVYVGGQTYSFDFPVTPPGPTPPFQGSIAENPDVTVTKYSNGTTPVLLWSTYLGGDSEESIVDVAVDVRNGYGVYAVGLTYSTAFPTTLPKLGGASPGFEGDGYVTKLSADGSFLLWSRRVGGSGYDSITAAALNSNGDILVVGATQSTFDYPVTPDAFRFSLTGSNDLGICILSFDGFSQLYGSYFGGTNTEEPTGASFDNSDTLFFITGHTDSSDFPVGGPNCHDITSNGGTDLFLVRFQIFGPGSTGAMYSSYLGGPDFELSTALAVDSSGNAYLAGYTYDGSFPFTIGAGWAGNSDGILARFNADGTLGWARYLGGSNSDIPYHLHADNSSSLYVAGYTNSFDFPVVNAFQPSLAGGLDAFITKIDPNGSSLAWSSFLGGTNSDLALGLAIGTPAGALGPSLYLIGETYSADFPKVNPTDGSFQGPEYFITRVDNSNPSAPGSLAQFRSGGVTPLAVGAWTPQPSILVRANVGDLDNDAVALQVEILPIDAPFPAVGVPTATGAYGASPREVSVPLPVPPALQQFHWRARTIDVHGRTSSWVVFGGNLDNPLPAARDVGRDPPTDPPTVSTLTPTMGTTYTTSVSPLTFTGSANDLISGIASVAWSNVASPPPVPSSGSATGSASWNVPSIPLSAGTNVITFTATDLAGNTGTHVVTVTYDTTPPQTTITGPTSSTTYLTGTGPTAGPPLGAPAGTLLLSGTAEDNAQVGSVAWQNFAGGSGAATITGGPPDSRTWEALITLTPGGNLIRVTTFDAANNLHVDEITVTYDNVAPTVNIVGAPTTTINPDVTLSGTAVDTNLISLVAWSNPAFPASGTAAPPLGSWTIPGISLAPGANLITVTAVDNVLFPSTLNAASASVTVYRDVAPPTINISSPVPPSFVTGNAAITVTGTATDDLNVASVTWTSNQGDSGTATLSGPTTSRSWSAACSLIAGPNLFTFSVSDGIRPAVTAQITITLSATAPSLVVSTPSASTSVTAASPFAMNGTAAAATGQSLVSITVTNTTTSVSPSVTGLGVWNVSVPLVIGTNAIEIVAEDDIGLTTTVTRTVILDPTAPAITITGPTGAASYATSAASVVLSGVASDNRGVASVAVVAGPAATLGGPPASVTWTTPAISLALGANVFTVQAVDEAGNTSTDVLTVTRDAAAPGITITSPTSASTLTTTVGGVVLGGFATDDVLLQVVTWINTATGASGSAAGTSSWTTASIALNPGANVITVLAVDGAGNTQTDTITVFLDGANPAVTITSPTSASSLDTPSATISLGGTASDDVQVAAISWSRSPGGLTGSGNGTQTWSIDSIPLVAGSNVITVTATDGAGRSSNDVITLVYDPTAPTIAVVSPATNPFSTTSTPQTISGTSADNLAVTQVDWTNTTTGGSGTASGTTTWTCLTPLTSGPNAILITARDAAGNTAVVAITVVYDPAAPVVDITSPTSGISLTTGITPIVIGGTSSDDVGVAAVTWTTSGAVGTTSGGAFGTDTWSFPVDLAPGENVITVTATDGVGRTGTTFLTVIYDASAPTVTITSPTTDPNFITVNAAVNLAGIAGDNLDLQSVAWANAATGAGDATVGVGSWTVNAVALNEGPNAITITATDGVGRTGVSVLTVVYDATNPLIDIVTPDNAATFPTSTRPLAIVGTASDNLGLASVTWTSDRGGGGTAALGVPGPGQWSTSVYLVAGLNVITFTAVDGHGRTATDQITIDFTPENAAPNILIATPLSGPAATQIVAFSGTADDVPGVVGVTWINRTTGVAGTATIAIPGVNPVSWSAAVPLTSGPNVLEATAVDDAGNTATASVTVTYTPAADAVDPVADITGPTTLDLYPSNVSPLTLTITATDNDGIAVIRWINDGTGGGGVATPGTLPNEWVASVALAFGTNVITITALDPSGNEETDQIIVTFAPLPGDGVPPVVTITSHSTASTLNVSAALLSLAGTASDNVAVTTVIWADDASGLTGSAAGTTGWAVDVTLVPGINILTLKAYDTSGNTGTTTLTVLYTPPPPPPEVVPAGSCGLLGLDAAVLILALAVCRCRRR